MGALTTFLLLCSLAISQAQVLTIDGIFFSNPYTAPIISANPDLLYSTANDYGIYGAPESLYSPTNDYGPVGAPEMINSVTNEYGYGLRVRLVEPVLESVEVPLEVP